jgi:hypothetical protein
MDYPLALRRSNRGGDHYRKSQIPTSVYKSRMDKTKLPRCPLGAGTYDLNTASGATVCPDDLWMLQVRPIWCH